MNFQQLRFAEAAHRTGSFTAAADLCCVSQPALSNSIAQLETELGAKVFERTTRTVTLTKFGNNIIDDIKNILTAKAHSLTHAGEILNHDDGTVHIGISPLVSDSFVAAMLKRVTEIDPDLDVIMSEMNKSDIEPAIIAGEIQFGFGPAPWEAIF